MDTHGARAVRAAGAYQCVPCTRGRTCNTRAGSLLPCGFAGYGGQQVFAREIELAAKVVGERFDVGQRSLLLVNEDRDVQKWPLASEAALAHVLRRLGELMDDEDVLFLSLSSHGDRDSAIEVTRRHGAHETACGRP